MSRLIYAVSMTALLVMSNAKAQDADAYQRYLRTGQIVLPQAPQAPQPTFDQLSNNLATYQGRPLDDAIDNFGPPAAQQVIAEHRVYTWAEHSTQEIPMPGIAITDGTVGDQPFSATTYGGGGTASMTAHCKLTMEVDDRQIVKRVWYDGNMAGCRQFMTPAVESSAQAPAEPARPTFAEVVKQQEATNGNKPLDEATLDSLYKQVRSQEAPYVYAAYRNNKASSEAELASMDSAYSQFKTGYLKHHPAFVSTTQSLNRDTVSQPTQAEQKFNQALTVGNLEQADDMLASLSEPAPGDAAQRAPSGRLTSAWLDRAEQQLASGDRIGAMQSLDKARKLAPNQPRVLDLTARLQGSP